MDVCASKQYRINGNLPVHTRCYQGDYLTLQRWKWKKRHAQMASVSVFLHFQHFSTIKCRTWHLSCWFVHHYDLPGVERSGKLTKQNKTNTPKSSFAKIIPCLHNGLYLPVDHNDLARNIPVRRIDDHLKQRLYSLHERIGRTGYTNICQELSIYG